jgi:hypothetical protein
MLRFRIKHQFKTADVATVGHTRTGTVLDFVVKNRQVTRGAPPRHAQVLQWGESGLCFARQRDNLFRVE